MGDHTDKLSRVWPLACDEDERPSREDLAGGRTLFDIPVPLPRLMKPRGRHRRG